MRNYIIIGADQASKATFDAPINSSINVQIAYNRNTGEIITAEHVSASDWTRYNDTDIITVCYTNKHMTAEQIKAAIIDAMSKIDSI